jgi:hypothetical protein
MARPIYPIISTEQIRIVPGPRIVEGAPTYATNDKRNEKPRATLEHLKNMIPSRAYEKEGEKHGGAHAGVVAIEGKDDLIRIARIRHLSCEGNEISTEARALKEIKERQTK